MNGQPSAVQREILQTRPFRSAAHEGVVGLLRTADRVRWHFCEVLAPYGMTLPQYNVLRVLRGAGPKGLPTLEVAERLIEHAPGITRMMDRLERRGWVRRERCSGDRRQVLCFLTTEGEKLLAELDKPIDRADEEALRGLTPAKQHDLIELLDRVRGALG
ncbi:MAG: MarR family transcriptional regulator [Gemmatimonadota bacterium]|nr:MAG: MarR family transcriptional regulator [Gemmatimonadota bacterium]